MRDLKKYGLLILQGVAMLIGGIIVLGMIVGFSLQALDMLLQFLFVGWLVVLLIVTGIATYPTVALAIAGAIGAGLLWWTTRRDVRAGR